MEMKNKAGLAIITVDKISIKTKAIIRDKGHHIMIKVSNQQRDITLVNIYALKIEALKYIKQILMNIRGETDINTVIVGDFNTPLKSMDRSPRQNINNETAALNGTLDKVDLIDAFKALHTKAAEYNSFQIHIEHFLGQITC